MSEESQPEVTIVELISGCCCSQRYVERAGEHEQGCPHVVAARIKVEQPEE